MVLRKNFMKFSLNFYGGNLIDFQTAKMSISQRRGIISLTPKDENNLMAADNIAQC